MAQETCCDVIVLPACRVRVEALAKLVEWCSVASRSLSSLRFVHALLVAEISPCHTVAKVLPVGLPKQPRYRELCVCVCSGRQR